MRVLVCGSSGCVGAAVVQALRSRGHVVIAASRGERDGPLGLRLDYMQPCSPAEWAERLRERRLDAIVNCIGILIATATQSFERVHRDGPIELFRGAALAGVPRVVQISALGADSGGASAYLNSKRAADDALAAMPGLDAAVLRPSLIHGPRSDSARLFATLASLPLISLPGGGRQPMAPIHVYEVAEIVARLVEQRAPIRAVHEIGGPAALSYREMLASYRAALGLGDALWLPLPLALMRAAALAGERLPQRVLSRDTVALLERGSVPRHNAAAALLGRAPTALAQGLRITPPQPWLDLRVQLAAPVALLLRAALAFMWLQTALISALLPEPSGVLRLLARCGFEGDAGVAMLVASCSLNAALGVLTLVRPSPALFLVQLGAIAGYTLTAAFNMPELTIDHCAPLVKNLPLFAAVLALALDAQRARPAAPAQPARAALRDTARS